jgi:thiol-disulfide isomerase/thioredoxin
MRLAALGLTCALALAACGAPATPTPVPAASEPGAATVAPDPATTAAASSVPSAAPASGDPFPSSLPSAAPTATEHPAAAALADKPWATAALTDVSTGETFTIADLAGKPVFIETMAIWCTNCRQQQARFTEAFGQMLPGIAEYVVLTVDPSETAEDLARYRDARGFTGRYAVAGRELAKALEAEFGANVLNPPSVPVVFVGPDGGVDFSTGAESVERILERAGV